MTTQRYYLAHAWYPVKLLGRYGCSPPCPCAVLEEKCCKAAKPEGKVVNKAEHGIRFSFHSQYFRIDLAPSFSAVTPFTSKQGNEEYHMLEKKPL